MKKHFIGFTLFSLIVASFVFVYAFFSAPSLLPKEAVKPPVSQAETPVVRPYSCKFRSNKLSYEVLSSQYLAKENKLVSKIKVSWNGYTEAPKKVYVTSLFSAVNNNERASFGSYEILESPFQNSDSKIVTVQTRVSGNMKVDEKDNLYVRFLVSDRNDSVKAEDNGNFLENHSVLYVH